MDFLSPTEVIRGLQDFLRTGGPLLTVIMISTFIMWAFILERLAYWSTAHRGHVSRAVQAWEGRSEHKSRFAHMVRDRLVSEVKQKAAQNVEIIKILVAIAPLLGLLGTVTGMIAVFEALSSSGESSARSMANGVFRATIPTMAGMVSAISGLYFATALERAAKKQTQRLADRLEIR